MYWFNFNHSFCLLKENQTLGHNPTESEQLGIVMHPGRFGAWAWHDAGRNVVDLLVAQTTNGVY